MPNKVVLVTGASGFIGKALVKTLCEDGYKVRATVRSDNAVTILSALKNNLQFTQLTIHQLGQLSDTTEWSPVLHGVDTIIHCAARAHVINETSSNPLDTFRQINCEATQHLARMASDTGVRRFIFLSSIGVLGNFTDKSPFSEQSIPNPSVPYAQAKLEAEIALKAIGGSMEIVIIRPPLVYGPGVKGNFLRLLELVNRNLPLPLGMINNKRQFIGIDNLVDFILTCITHSNAANETFLVADNEILSTTALIRLLSKGLGSRNILIPVPHQLLTWCLQRIGKRKLAEQLINNLEIDLTHTKQKLKWEPPYTISEQLKHTVTAYTNKE